MVVALAMCVQLAVALVLVRRAYAADAIQVSNANEWTSAIQMANTAGKDTETTIEITGNFTLPSGSGTGTEITGNVRITGTGTITYSGYNGIGSTAAKVKVNGGVLTIDSDGVTFKQSESDRYNTSGLFWVDNSGSLTLNAGTINHSNYAFYSKKHFIEVTSRSSFTVAGGMIQNMRLRGEALVDVDATSSFVMSGGVIRDVRADITVYNDGGVVLVKGSLAMTGGSFENVGVPGSVEGAGELCGHSAIRLTSGATGTISGGSFTGCGGSIEKGSSATGGAVRVDSGATLNISGNPSFSGNVAEEGGALYIAGTVNMSGGEIANNVVTHLSSGNCYGGGIYLNGNGSKLVITGGAIHNNILGTNSGGRSGSDIYIASGSVTGLDKLTIGQPFHGTGAFCTDWHKEHSTGDDHGYAADSVKNLTTITNTSLAQSGGYIIGPGTSTYHHVYWIIPTSYATKAGYSVDDIAATRYIYGSGTAETTQGALYTSGNSGGHIVVADSVVKEGDTPTPPTMTNFTWFNRLRAGTKNGSTETYTKQKAVSWTSWAPSEVYDAYVAVPGTTDTWYYQFESGYGQGTSYATDKDGQPTSSLPAVSTTTYYILAMTDDVNTGTVTYSYTGTVPADAPAVPAQQTVAVGTEVTVAAAPTLAGYTFSGWTATGATVADDGKFTMPDGDVTITGSWTANKHKVTYRYTGDVPDGFTPPAAQTHDYGDTVTIPAAPDAPEGYTFTGWTVSGATEENGSFTMPNNAVTVTGVWKANEYTITFDTDGGTAVDPITQKYGTTVTAPADPTKSGHTFAGWDTTIPSTMPARDMTIKATWTVNSHDVSYEYAGTVPDGAPAVPANVSTAYGTTVTVAAAPTLAGYTFIGWTATGATVTDGSFTMPDKAVTLSGSWVPAGDTPYKVEHYLQQADGSWTLGSTDSLTGQTGATATATPSAPEHYHYDADNASNVTSGTIAADGGLTLRLYYALDTHAVTFRGEDGSTISGPTSYPYGTPAASVAVPEAPAKADDDQYRYAFAGWSPAVADVTGDATYTATYAATRRSYTVRFVGEDGTVLQEGQVPYGEVPVFAGQTPAKADDGQYSYAFAGWTPAVVPVTGDATYTATFSRTPITRTVTFDANGGSEVPAASVPSGSPVGRPDDPTRAGYTFKGWTLDGEPYDFSTPVTGDLTLVASWEEAAEPTPAPTPGTTPGATPTPDVTPTPAPAPDVTPAPAPDVVPAPAPQRTAAGETLVPRPQAAPVQALPQSGDDAAPAVVPALAGALALGAAALLRRRREG